MSEKACRDLALFSALAIFSIGIAILVQAASGTLSRTVTSFVLLMVYNGYLLGMSRERLRWLRGGK